MFNMRARGKTDDLTEDVQAIRRIKSGDMGGLESLMDRYQVKAARAAFLITHDQIIAQDVVQETFIRIYQRVHQFDERYPFEPYLMRSIINASLNAMRGTDKQVSLDGGDGEIRDLLDLAASVESQAEFSHLQDEIMGALSRLPLRQRAAIVQRYYLEMSEKEMAQALDIQPGTVKWLLNAARERLRSLLGQKGGLDE
jgi:RNA polymerase sigma-70 factor (ECF subfamily)